MLYYTEMVTTYIQQREITLLKYELQNMVTRFLMEDCILFMEIHLMLRIL